MQTNEDQKGKYTQTHRPHGTLAMLISNSLPPSVPVSLSPSLLRSDARQDLFALPPSSKFAIALGIGTGLPGLPRWL